MTTSDDRRPDAGAGRAEDDKADVYAGPATAYAREIVGVTNTAEAIARERWLHVVVDAARAPLLARASEDALRIEGLAAAVNRSHNHCISRADLLAVRAERDQARAELAAAVEETQEIATELASERTELADVTRKFAEAQALLGRALKSGDLPAALHLKIGRALHGPDWEDDRD